MKFWTFWNYLQNKETIKTSKPSFCYLTLTFSMICLLLRVLHEFHFHLKWYQSKGSRETQPLSCPTLFNLKSGREELQGKSSRKSDIDKIVFNHRHPNGKRILAWKPKASSKKMFWQKIKKYPHFQTITTNNSKHFFWFHIKQHWHFHWVTPKQYCIHFQTLNNADIFRELLVNNTTRLYQVYIKQYWHFQRGSSKLNYSKNVFQSTYHTTMALSESYYQTVLPYSELISNSIHTFTKLLPNNNNSEHFFERLNGHLNR